MHLRALTSGLLASLFTLASVGCEPPSFEDPAEHELTGDGKSDVVTFPAIARRQAVLLSGYTQTRDRRDSKVTETHFALRFALEVGAAPMLRAAPVELAGPVDGMRAGLDAGAPADLGRGLDAGGTATSAGLPISFRLCDLAITGAHDLSADPQLYERIPAATGAVRLYATTATAPIRARTAAPIALALGVKLVAPLTDTLPTTGTDPRVVDTDGDGNPGVSLHVALGRIFAAVRVVFRLDGTVVPSMDDDGASFAGGVSADQLDLVAFGDTVPFYDAVTSLAEGRVNSELLAQSFGFRSIAVDGDGSCVAVRAATF